LLELLDADLLKVLDGLVHMYVCCVII